MRVKEQQEFVRKFPVKHKITFVEGEYDDKTPLHVYAQKALEEAL